MLGITKSILALIYGQLVQAAFKQSAECCTEKKVGKVTYVLATEADTTAYNCINNCIYEEKENPGKQFCFGPVELPMKYIKQQGVKCGIKNKPRIIGGKEVEVNVFPWMVTIANEDKVSFCGGTLVASKWVLSARHCFFKDALQNEAKEASDLLVVFGDHNDKVSREHKITKTIRLESYILPTQRHWDIAMIKLAEEVDLVVYTPVCLASPGDSFTGKKAWSYGWGAKFPEKLQKLVLTISSAEQCQAEMIEDGWMITITNGMLCASGKTRGDSCPDHGGGPLTVDVDGQHVLVGVSSFVDENACAQDGYYGGVLGVYAEVAVLRQWVDDTIALDGQSTTE